MHIKRIHEMEEKLTEIALCEINKGIECVNTAEMGAVIDMIKDLACAEKEAREAKEMEKEEEDEKKDTHLSERKQIIEYLNQKLRTRYRHGSDINKKYINARLNEGYTVDDFYEVIDKKCNEWQGTERERYLRPETLFGNKFESYLNQNMVKEEKPKNINASRQSQLEYLLSSIREDEENDRNGG